MNSAYLGLDCGTTSIKCLAVDSRGHQLYVSSRVHPSISPKSGWLEQDPDSWIEPAFDAITECVANLSGYTVKALAMSGHMSSPVFLDKNYRPVYNCMTVGDARCEKEASYLIKNYEAMFKECSNNKPMACFGAAKILWFKNNLPELYSKTRYIICAKDYIRFVLTGKINTDPTDAGNMLLYDFKKRDWNYNLISQIGIDSTIFPPVIDSMRKVGNVRAEVADRCGLSPNTSVYCGGADMACSNIGTASSEEGTMAITLSTSGQICMTVKDIAEKGYGKITFHPAIQENSMYAMASVFSGGLALNWCFELLMGKNELTNEDLAEMTELSEKSDRYMPCKSGVLFTPFLLGSGSPYFLSNDRSAFVGVSFTTDRCALFASVIEGICLHINENIDVFRDIGCRIKKVRLSGGGTKNHKWVQVISDVTGLKIEVLQCPDASTLGAAIIALCAEEREDITEIARNAVPVKENIIPEENRTRRYRKLNSTYKKIHDCLLEVNAEIESYLKEDTVNE